VPGLHDTTAPLPPHSTRAARLPDFGARFCGRQAAAPQAARVSEFLVIRCDDRAFAGAWAAAALDVSGRDARVGPRAGNRTYVNGESTHAPDRPGEAACFSKGRSGRISPHPVLCSRITTVNSSSKRMVSKKVGAPPEVSRHVELSR
jgi:hypothetical protein